MSHEVLGQEGIPRELRSAVERTLTPVRPLWRPGTRALALLPIAVVLLAAIRMSGVRFDADRLGSLGLWGLSLLQVSAGLLVVVLAFRESVPGESLSRRGLSLVIGSVLIWLASVTLVTWIVSPVQAPVGREDLYWRICVSWPIVYALPFLAGTLFLVRRAYPMKAGLIGALCGLGAGLIIDGGWRTYCEVSLPEHVVGSHLVALGAVTALGAIAGALSARRGVSPPGFAGKI